MSKDCTRTHVHLHAGRMADLMEDFCRDKVPFDGTYTHPKTAGGWTDGANSISSDIYVPPHHQPLNPEDEDDVIPDQHAAFGIVQAQQKKHEPAWKDLGLSDLLNSVPKEGVVTVKNLPR